MLQHVAVCCSRLQCVAVLICMAQSCSVSQALGVYAPPVLCVAVCCRVLQSVAGSRCVFPTCVVCCSMLQSVAEFCRVLQALGVYAPPVLCVVSAYHERWGAGVETQKNVRGEIGGWGRVPFNETYAPSLSTIYDGA